MTDPHSHANLPENQVDFDDEYCDDDRNTRPASPWSPSVSDQVPAIKKIPSRPPPSPESPSSFDEVEVLDEKNESDEAPHAVTSPKETSPPRAATIVGDDILPPLITELNQCCDCKNLFPSFDLARLHQCDSQRWAEESLNSRTSSSPHLPQVPEVGARKVKTPVVLAPGEKPCKRRHCGRKRYNKGLCKYHYYKWYYAHPGVKRRQRRRVKKPTATAQPVN